MDAVEEIVALDGHGDVSILRPRDAAALIDERAFARDEMLPYWADLWPSARLLARTLARRALRGRRVLELGCGLGLSAIAAALAGGRVSATDWVAGAIAATRANAARNDVAVDAFVCSWQEPRAIVARAPWDLVVAADVLYERRNIIMLLDLLPRLGPEIWIADPGRATSTEFFERADEAGWARTTLAREAGPTASVERLRPPPAA